MNCAMASVTGPLAHPCDAQRPIPMSSRPSGRCPTREGGKIRGRIRTQVLLSGCEVAQPRTPACGQLKVID